jgi:hypothetical protein
VPFPSGRRRFLSSLAATPLLPAALAQSPAAAPPAAAPPSPTPSPTPRDAVAEALTEAARRLFGDRFPSDQADDVRQSIAENLQAAERLRALGLGNADEPVTLFTPRGRRAPARAPVRR